MARVGSATRLYAVVGHPVAHSLSPRIQNAAFAAAGLDAVFVALDLSPDRFEAALSGLHAAGVAGLNVTLPHKEAACRAAAERSPEAARSGAANALLWTERGYRAHATDGAGFLAWVRELGIPLRGRRVLLLGAGGAARDVAFSVLDAGAAALRVVSRSGPRAAQLVALLAAGPLVGREERDGERETTRAVDGAALMDGERARSGEAWEVLVRAIPPDRLVPGEDAWWEAVVPEAPVLDLNYGERAAGSRARAAAERRPHADGSGLLLHQGALSFEFWTGRPAPVDAMRRALGSG